MNYGWTVSYLQGLSEKCTGAFKFGCRVICRSIILSKSCHKSGFISLSIYRIHKKIFILCFNCITKLNIYKYIYFKISSGTLSELSCIKNLSRPQRFICFRFLHLIWVSLLNNIVVFRGTRKIEDARKHQFSHGIEQMFQNYYWFLLSFTYPSFLRLWWSWCYFLPSRT